MHITLRQFEIFRAVARSGRVTEAARQLHLSQPAASMALSELEKQLGRLFDRHPRLGLLLNDAGRALLPKACELVDRAREIELQFSTSGDMHLGAIRVCASSTVGNNLMPGLLSEFGSHHAEVSSTLMISNRLDIEHQLLSFDTDIAVIEGACLHPDIVTTRWRNDELVVICPPDHILAGEEGVSVEALRDERWVVREYGSSTREVFDRMIATHLKIPRIAMELNRAEAVKRAVADGLGVACMSTIAASEALASGSVKPLACGMYRCGGTFLCWFTNRNI